MVFISNKMITTKREKVNSITYLIRCCCSYRGYNVCIICVSFNT